MADSHLIFTEDDYGEILYRLIRKLESIGALRLAEKIRDLEKENIIERIPPYRQHASKKEPGNIWQPPFYEVWEESFSPGRSEKEAVSKYRSRPMTNREMFHAALQMLSSCLQTVPRMLETTRRDLAADSLSSIVWANERHQEEPSPYRILQTISRDEYIRINAILDTLKAYEDSADEQ